MRAGELEIIRELAKFSAEGDIDVIATKVAELVCISPLSLGSIYSPGTVLYRTTNHHVSVPSRIEEIWYPPAEFAKLSRANRHGHPMFYCSSDPGCTFWEIGMSVGQLFVNSKWVTIKEMMLHDLGYSKQVFDRLKSTRRVPDTNQSFEASRFTKVHEYIHLAFTEECNPNYALTAAIAEVHLRSEQLSGIKYPSIKKKAMADNLALIPDFARHHLTLDSAQVVKVDTIGSDSSIEGVVIADLLDVTTDGILTWNFRNKGPSLAPGEGRILAIGVHRFQESGQINVLGKTYRIEPGYTIENLDNTVVVVKNLRGEIVLPNDN